MIIEKPKLDIIKEKLEKIQTDLFCTVALLNEIYLNAENQKSTCNIVLLTNFDKNDKDT